MPSPRVLLRAAVPVILPVVLGATACAGSTATSTPPGSNAAAGRDATGTTKPAAVFPGADWDTIDPASAGFDPAALTRVAEAAESGASNCMLVVRHGKVVGEWYWNGKDASSAQEVFSATKSYASTLVGIAQDEGKLSIDDPAAKYITEWSGTPAEAVTVKHLLSNNSGRQWDYETDYFRMAAAAPDKTQFAIDLGTDAPPGEVWEYNNSAIQTLDRVIGKAVGESPADYAQRKLLDPIGMRQSRMTKDQAGNTLTFMGLQSTCRDMARYGWLFLNDGNWNGQQVVPAQWVKDATTSSQALEESYGYLWWLNCVCRSGRSEQATEASEASATTGPARKEQMVPGAPESAYFALGAGGQYLAVFPDEGVVAVRLVNVVVPKDTAKFEIDDIAKVVTEALRN